MNGLLDCWKGENGQAWGVDVHVSDRPPRSLGGGHEADDVTAGRYGRRLPEVKRRVRVVELVVIKARGAVGLDAHAELDCVRRRDTRAV